MMRMMCCSLFAVVNTLFQVATSHGMDLSDSCTIGNAASSHFIQSNATTWPWQSFKTSSLKPPNLSINRTNAELAEGYIFISPSNQGPGSSIRQSAPLIVTDANELVFGLEIAGTTDFRVQGVNGTSYLTYWSGQKPTGANIQHGDGAVYFLDQEYKTAYTVCPELNLNTNLDPAPKCQIDIHEHQVTPRSTILVTAYNATPADLSVLNGSADSFIQDSLFYEVDIQTSEILFRWSAIEHVPIQDTYQPLVSRFGNGSVEAPFDYFHINSVEAVGSNYLISARHTWSVYLIDGHNGDVIWTLDGETGGDFATPPPDGHFRWQHDARAHNVTETSMDMSLFNNYNSENGNGTAPTNGLILHLPLSADSTDPPSVISRLEVSSEEIYDDSQGDYQLGLSNGNQFMGYGQIPILREYGPLKDGSDLRWEGRFGLDNLVQSYRGFKMEWHGTPADWDPVLVVEGPSGQSSGEQCSIAHVSWNGATDVESWNIYSGVDESSLVFSGTVPKLGYETNFQVPSSGCIEARAVQCNEEVRCSNVVCR